MFSWRSLTITRILPATRTSCPPSSAYLVGRIASIADASAAAGGSPRTFYADSETTLDDEVELLEVVGSAARVGANVHVAVAGARVRSTLSASQESVIGGSNARLVMRAVGTQELRALVDQQVRPLSPLSLAADATAFGYPASTCRCPNGRTELCNGIFGKCMIGPGSCCPNERCVEFVFTMCRRTVPAW